MQCDHSADAVAPVDEEPVDALFDVAADDSVILRVRVQPGAKRTEVVGRHGDALRIRVQAPADRGRANEAVVQCIAEVLGLRPADVELLSGLTNRSKRLRIRGMAPGEVRRRLSGGLRPFGG